MNIAIVGSRSFKDYELLKSELERFISEKALSEVKIVSGGAVGTDTLAEKFAEEKGFETLIFLPERDKYGRDATFLRNTQIIENSDVVFAFWNGISSGTKDSITKAEKLKKELLIYLF